MAPKLLRLPSSWATEISFQSRYPGGILVTKMGACLSACPDAGAVNASAPPSVAPVTSKKASHFIGPSIMNTLCDDRFIVIRGVLRVIAATSGWVTLPTTLVFWVVSGGDLCDGQLSARGCGGDRLKRRTGLLSEHLLDRDRQRTDPRAGG